MYLLQIDRLGHSLHPGRGHEEEVSLKVGSEIIKPVQTCSHFQPHILRCAVFSCVHMRVMAGQVFQKVSSSKRSDMMKNYCHVIVAVTKLLSAEYLPLFFATTPFFTVVAQIKPLLDKYSLEIMMCFDFQCFPKICRVRCVYLSG